MKNIGKCRKKTIWFIGINVIIFALASSLIIREVVLEKFQGVNSWQLLLIMTVVLTVIFVLCAGDDFLIFNRFRKRHRKSQTLKP